MDALRKAGLTTYESLIYLSLLKFGMSDAQAISTHSSVPKTAVYPNLKHLIAANLVQEVKGKPSWFEALPPEVGLTQFLERKAAELQTVKQEVLAFVKNIGREKKDAEEEKVFLVRGREASKKFYHATITTTMKYLYILGWRSEKIGDKYTFLQGFKNLLKKGVDVRLIVTGERARLNKTLLRDFKRTGIRVRRLGVADLSLMISDSRECKITLKSKELKDKFTIYISDEALAKAMTSYFLDCWNRAEKI